MGVGVGLGVGVNVVVARTLGSGDRSRINAVVHTAVATGIAAGLFLVLVGQVFAPMLEFLKELRNRYSCIDGIELLPFKKICTVKYQKMGIPFPFESFETPSSDRMKELEALLATK